MGLTTEVEPTRAPLRVVVINDYTVVVRGVAQMLEPFHDRVEVVELTHGTHVAHSVHIALYDPCATGADYPADLDLLAGDPMVQHVVLYTWTITDEVVHAATDGRVCGVLLKSLTAPELVDALERICAGESVISPEPEGEDPRTEEWPGQHQGLTPRQSEVIVLVVAGLTNKDIAERCYLSINSVKSYIRAAYRTMGVDSRTKAVLWGIEHGLRADPHASPCRQPTTTQVGPPQSESGGMTDISTDSPGPREMLPKASGVASGSSISLARTS